MRIVLKSSVVYAILGLIPFVVYFHPTWGLEKLLGAQSLDILKLLPYLTFGVIGYLGYKLNQTRILFTSALLLAVYSWRNNQNYVIEVLAVILPVSIILFYSFKESPFGGNKTLFRLITALVPCLSLIYLYHFDQSLYGLLINFKVLPFNKTVRKKE